MQSFIGDNMRKVMKSLEMRNTLFLPIRNIWWSQQKPSIQMRHGQNTHSSPYVTLIKPSSSL